MNCDNDFYLKYNNTYVKVKPFCESSDTHYKIYLQDGEVKLTKYLNDEGTMQWRESGIGESQLAQQLGRLIDEQQKDS